MQQLSATDASFVYLETPNTPMHIGSLAIYDPSTAPNKLVRYKDILAHIEARLHTARSFRQRLLFSAQLTLQSFVLDLQLTQRRFGFA